MGSEEIQARHVINTSLSGVDLFHAWQEATGEPVFAWGRRSGGAEGLTFGPIRRQFAQWIEGTRHCPITIYHDGLGADALGALDAAPHKICHVHSWFPRWERHFAWFIRCTGKVIVGDTALAARLKPEFEWIPDRYIFSLKGPPLLGKIPGKEQRKAPGARTGIWLQGKSWRRYGNRLRSIVDHWRKEAGELEIICGGKGRPRWANREGLVWNAGMPTEFALLRMFTWDAVLLLDAGCLDAPWILRALELGCFPLVPDDGNENRPGLWDAEDAPTPYPWGDIDAAIALLKSWREERITLEPAFTVWSERLRSEHPGGPAFKSHWSSLKRSIVEQRSPNLRPRPLVPSWHSPAWYERMVRLRAGVA